VTFLIQIGFFFTRCVPERLLDSFRCSTILCRSRGSFLKSGPDLGSALFVKRARGLAEPAYEKKPGEGGCEFRGPGAKTETCKVEPTQGFLLSPSPLLHLCILPLLSRSPLLPLIAVARDAASEASFRRELFSRREASPSPSPSALRRYLTGVVWRSARAWIDFFVRR
jgi:hypothetical protein